MFLGCPHFPNLKRWKNKSQEIKLDTKRYSLPSPLLWQITSFLDCPLGNFKTHPVSRSRSMSFIGFFFMNSMILISYGCIACLENPRQILNHRLLRNVSDFFAKFFIISLQSCTGPVQGQNRVFPAKFSTQGKTCFYYREPLFLLQGPLFSLQGFPCEKTSQGNPCFHCREWVCSAGSARGRACGAVKKVSTANPFPVMKTGLSLWSFLTGKSL